MITTLAVHVVGAWIWMKGSKKRKIIEKHPIILRMLLLPCIIVTHLVTIQQCLAGLCSLISKYVAYLSHSAIQKKQNVYDHVFISSCLFSSVHSIHSLA